MNVGERVVAFEKRSEFRKKPEFRKATPPRPSPERGGGFDEHE